MPAVGGCSNWKISTGSALSTTLLTQVATSVSMFVYNDNRSVANFIVSYLYVSLARISLVAPFYVWFSPLIVFLFFFSFL